jgi:hypothetical protein
MPTALYYTCLSHPPAIEVLCRENLARVLPAGFTLITVSRGEPIAFGDKNIVVQGERGVLTMHRQILAGLEAAAPGPVFHVENDVLYHPSHFDFLPPRKDTFFFNTHVWKWLWPTGPAMWTDDLQQLSGMVADRALELDYYRARVAELTVKPFDRHYEPQRPWKRESYRAQASNVCIRHKGNLTPTKRSPADFRNSKYAKGWRETFDVPGWGDMRELLSYV